ncbi:MAG TPA: 50S ribosomal protein L6 [Thermomicrobiales bacterium]|jgi:large subunit ribosomal protein L6|nr:50S ribosomal protein L6 [Thermomicrobiales bacterium]
MSRIGKRPIAVPSSVTITIDDANNVSVKGPKGELSSSFNQDMRLTREDGTLLVERPSDAREHRAVHGLTRTLLANMVTGVTDGFTRVLTIQGVGYRSAMDGKTLVLTVGYSHPVRIEPNPGITFAVENQTRVTVSGIDKQAVGEQAAQIRRVRPPEPYKGKGIRYDGEVVRRKAGKTGKGK